MYQNLVMSGDMSVSMLDTYTPARRSAQTVHIDKSAHIPVVQNITQRKLTMVTRNAVA